MVKSEKIYSPQNYLEFVTGECYIVSGDNDIKVIESILEENGYSSNNYPLTEIEIIVEKSINVVLVECVVYNENKHEYEYVYRWFEVQEGK